MDDIYKKTNRKLNILVPDVVDMSLGEARSKAEIITHNSEKDVYFVELENLTRELNLIPVIHRMLLSNMKSIMASIPRQELILNLCDGSDVDGVPGPSVAVYLEENDYPRVIGCDSTFINNTLTKNGMKEIFKNHLVSTPPGFGADINTDLVAEIVERGMMYPLFVKISDSYGSVGLDDSSVCHTQDDLLKKCANLFKEFDNLTCEEYIEGQEFSVLIMGNCRDPEANVIVYPPAERAFNPKLGQYQRFISFDRNWDETLLAHSYERVNDPNDSIALQDLARRAYISVSGNCYGRVDIRKRDVSGKFYVLEVNASCGLGNGTSSDFILKLAGQSNEDFFKILLSTTLAKSLMDGELVADLKVVNIIPSQVKIAVSKMISNPRLAKVPTPIVHVIVSAVVLDMDSGYVLDPECKLSDNYGKDAEYVSELECIFRNIGYDPIVHLFNVDNLEEIFEGLDKNKEIIFNACLGKDGYQVASLCDRLGMTRTVGLHAKFFLQSASRPETRNLLSANNIKIPQGIVTKISYDLTSNLDKNVKISCQEIETLLKNENIEYPLYVKPGIAARHFDGQNSGRKIFSNKDLVIFLEELFSSQKVHEDEIWIFEKLIIGSEFRVLVAGDGTDPNRDVIVLPPIKMIALGGNKIENDQNSSKKSLLERKQSLMKIDKLISSKSISNYQKMNDNELILQMDVQDLARRAYCAVHGGCYGLVHVVDRQDGKGLVVLGVQGDVRFGENTKASVVMRLAGLNMNDLFQWLIIRC